MEVNSLSQTLNVYKEKFAIAANDTFAKFSEITASVCSSVSLKVSNIWRNRYLLLSVDSFKQINVTNTHIYLGVACVTIVVALVFKKVFSKNKIAKQTLEPVPLETPKNENKDIPKEDQEATTQTKSAENQGEEIPPLPSITFEEYEENRKKEADSSKKDTKTESINQNTKKKITPTGLNISPNTIQKQRSSLKKTGKKETAQSTNSGLENVPPIENNTIPAKQAQVPIKLPQHPKQAQIPVKQPQPPKQAHISAKQPQFPAKQIQIPAKLSQPPLKEDQAPAGQGVVPTKESEIPVKQVEAPTKQAEFTAKQPQVPVKEAEFTVTQPQIPNIDNQTSVDKDKTLNSGTFITDQPPKNTAKTPSSHNHKSYPPTHSLDHKDLKKLLSETLDKRRNSWGPKADEEVVDAEEEVADANDNTDEWENS